MENVKQYLVHSILSIGLVFSLSILAGCAGGNQVVQVASEAAVVRYQQDSKDKVHFANLHPGKKDYKYNCTENCYPDSPFLDCESTAEACLFAGKQTRPDLDTGFSLKWLGHASFSLHAPNGSDILVDPVSGQFDWPVNWAFRLSGGFNRNEPAWLSQQQISQTNLVLYSHVHYDHFNKSDIGQIGNKAEFLVPLGMGAHFPDGEYLIREMPWFSTVKYQGLAVHFVPAHHFSSRIWVPYLYEDEDTTLWGGWVLEYQARRLFYAGDTGYSEHFRAIQKHYGDMDICLLPIASYYHAEYGDWYRYVHTTPEDALLAAEDLNCKVMIPWGYGNASWKMGDHSSHSPLLRLLHMHKTLDSDVRLHILNEGEDLHL